MNNRRELFSAFFAAVVATVVVAPLVYIGFIALLRAFPPPEDVVGYADVMAAALALIGALTAVSIKLLISGRDSSHKPDQRAPTVSEDGADATRGGDIDYVRMRKEQYKQAYLQQKVLLAREADRRSRHTVATAVLVSTLGFAILVFASTLVAGGVTWIHAPNGTTNEPLPAWVSHLQMYLLIAGAVMLPAIVYNNYLHKLGSKRDLKTALLIGSGGTALSGGLFFVQLTPEAIAFINTGPGRVELVPGFGVPFFLYLVVQRTIMVPVLAALGVGLVWLVRTRLLARRAAQETAKPLPAS